MHRHNFTVICYLVCNICISKLHSMTGAATSCSKAQRDVNLSTCLNDINSALFDNTLFWFGTPYATRCPNGIAGGMYCANYDPNRATSIMTRMFDSMDYGPNLDRFLEITYDSIGSMILFSSYFL